MKTYEICKKKGIAAGIYSCCSSNQFVLDAALQRALKHDTCVLIEATSNQVNQFGGYTGMTPDRFYQYVMERAAIANMPSERVILGGDHLGPLTWVSMPEEEAMCNAEELVRQYVLAGFTKIHIDTSMRVADDSTELRLPEEVIARRGARLVAAAEKAYCHRFTFPLKCSAEERKSREQSPRHSSISLLRTTSRTNIGNRRRLSLSLGIG